jgi:hypothetical protein
MIEIEISAPERFHMEVVKVVSVQRDEVFVHPDGNLRVEYLYLDEDSGWEGPGDGDPDPHVFYVDGLDWPYVVYFSDGSCGVIYMDGLETGLGALGVRLI